MTALEAPGASVAAQEARARRAKIRAQQRNAVLRALGKAAWATTFTMVVVVVLWQAAITFTDVSTFTAKGPVDVFNYLFVTEAGAAADDTAAAHRAELWPLLNETIKDSAIGFFVGLAIAIALAMSFTLSKSVEAGVMPFALFLRSVPLVAIAPAILLITGRGSLLSVAVIGCIVVLFPALASVMFGLGRASPQSLDLVKVYGGSSWSALLKVAIPGALPSIFAAARVSVPGAVTGAMLAEWLSTGGGIGGAIPRLTASVKYDDLWSAVALITIATLLIYNLVQVLENIVLARMGMSVSTR